MGGGCAALSEILTKILKTAVQRPLRAWTSLCLRKSRGGGVRLVANVAEVLVTALS